MTSNVPIKPDERRVELKAILSSREFTRAPALAKLLIYLCEKAFEGKVHEIKEFSIATEVYGRDSTFGERRDSVVRVEASRLRKRLKNFYEQEGAGHALRIVIPPGRYQPEFEHVAMAAAVPSSPPAAAARPSRRLAAGAAIAGTVLAAVGLWGVLRKAPAQVAVPIGTAKSVTGSEAGAGAPPNPVRILAGSSVERSVDRFGVEWLGDRYFSGGEQNRWQIGNKEMGAPERVIRGAPDQLLFHSFRFGGFSYRIPLPKGRYELKLYFSEVIYLPTDVGDGVDGRRTFDVLMNGRPLLTNFDIAADAGGTNTADIRVFDSVSPVDGHLLLEFRPVLGGAWLNAIEIVPNDTGHPLPVRIVTRNANIMDHEGNLWEVDRYFFGGRQLSDGVAVAGTQDPELFKWQRFGNFTYRFPVPPGKYRLRLLFAETFFGPHNRGKGGLGSRVFNVYSSGTTLLRNFEIFKEAGEDRALEKIFHGITPNAQGRIDVTFEPVFEYAAVQGIELIPEK
jgi:Malectin domain